MAEMAPLSKIRHQHTTLSAQKSMNIFSGNLNFNNGRLVKSSKSKCALTHQMSKGIRSSGSRLLSSGSTNSVNKSLVPSPKCVSCFVCKKTVQENQFSKHLLLGRVKCITCGLVFTNCQKLQLWEVEKSMGLSSCVHILEFLNDPLKSLRTQISLNYDDSWMCDKNRDDSVLDDMIKKYIKSLGLLRKKLPWRQVILQYREMVVKDKCSDILHKNCSLGDDFCNETLQNNGKDILENCEMQFIESELNISTMKEPNSEMVILGSKLMTEQTGSDAIFPGNSSSSIRQEKASAAGDHNETLNCSEVPSKGFFFISPRAVEECPNCYALLCPSQFTVNVNTYTLSCVCCECELTIYIDTKLNS